MGSRRVVRKNLLGWWKKAEDGFFECLCQDHSTRSAPRPDTRSGSLRAVLALNIAIDEGSQLRLGQRAHVSGDHAAIFEQH